MLEFILLSGWDGAQDPDFLFDMGQATWSYVLFMIVHMFLLYG